MLKKKISIIIMCLMIVWLGAIPVLAEETDPDKIIIKDGVSVEYLDLSGYTLTQAKAVIDEYIDEVKQVKAVFKIGSREVSTTLGELGLGLVNTNLLDQTQGRFDSGSLLSQYKAKEDFSNSSIHLDIIVAVDEDLLIQYMIDNMKLLEGNSKNASLERVNGQMIVTPSKNGVLIDYEETFITAMRVIKEEAELGNAQLAIDVVCEETTPYVTTEILSGIGDLLGESMSTYDAGNKERSTNVDLAASRFNGTIILPGEVCSALAIMGPMDANGGYKNAPTYNQGEIVDDIGGGVCQVSSTLYNAVLASEFEVTVRRPHSMMVSYVKPSMDAMVYWKSDYDFAFINNTSKAIYIESWTEKNGNKGTLRFKIYGFDERPANRKVVYEVDIKQKAYPNPPYEYTVDDKLDEWDPLAGPGENDVKKLFVIEAPHASVIAHLIKKVYVDGVLITEEHPPFYYSKYKPLGGTVRYSPSITIKKITNEGDIIVEGNDEYFGVEKSTEQTSEAPTKKPEVDPTKPAPPTSTTETQMVPTKEPEIPSTAPPVIETPPTPTGIPEGDAETDSLGG